MKPLLLNGKPIEFRRTTPSVDRLLEHLKGLPDGEVFDKDAILVTNKIGIAALHRASKYDSRMAPYCYLAPGTAGNGLRYLYGNAKAINQLKKLVGQS